MTYAEAVRHIAMKSVGFNPDAPAPPPIVVDDPYVPPPPTEHDKAVADARAKCVSLDDVRQAEREVQAALLEVAVMARLLVNSEKPAGDPAADALKPGLKAALQILDRARARLRVLEEART